MIIMDERTGPDPYIPLFMPRTAITSNRPLQMGKGPGELEWLGFWNLIGVVLGIWEVRGNHDQQGP